MTDSPHKDVRLVVVLFLLTFLVNGSRPAVEVIGGWNVPHHVDMLGLLASTLLARGICMVK
jgi:hypothetical protein